MQYYVYLVECANGTYYCGYTNELDARIKNHNYSKKGAKYTKSRRPVKLVYSKIFKSKSQAMKHEYEIKKLTRKKKEALISGK